MNEEQRYQITSEEYADLIVEYHGNISYLESFPDSSFNIIDSKYAVVHMPVAIITNNSLFSIGYNRMPKCYGLMSTLSLESSGVIAARNLPNYQLYGKDVLIGIVDTGIDYTNPVFLNQDNTTRIATIWDQTIESDNYPENFFYGTEYDRVTINNALSDNNPLSIVPSTDEIGHGTNLAAIAGGAPVEEYDFEGVATESEFVIVKLKQAKSYLREFFRIPEGVPCYQANDIMFGLKYLLEVSRRLERPIAICIGVGTSQGAHQGVDILSDYIDFVGRSYGTALIVAAGNEGYPGHHYFGTIEINQTSDEFVLNVGENEEGFSMEIWGTAPFNYSAEVYAPSGDLIGMIPITYQQQETKIINYEGTTLLIDNTLHESITGDQLIIFRFWNALAGNWRFRILGRSDLSLTYHVWLPISNFLTSDTYLLDSDPYITLTSPGNAEIPIVVTAYNPEDGSLYENASRGFTKIDLKKPDIAAPGVNVITPTTGNEFINATGTGMAAALTTGVAALMLEWGIIRGNLTTMNSLDIRKMFTVGASRDPDLVYPNQEWGFGTLNLISALQNAYTITVNPFYFI